MDYSKLLFAYHVREEAEKILDQKYPEGISSADYEYEIERLVGEIVKSTHYYAELIEKQMP